MFYAPWCGHCKVLAPKLSKAAKVLTEVGVGVGGLDVEPSKDIQQRYTIKGFPACKLLPGDGGKAIDYEGPREIDDIVRWSKEQVEKLGTAPSPTASIKFDQAWTFLHGPGTDAPAALLVGAPGDAAPPSWLGNFATEFKESIEEMRARDGKKRATHVEVGFVVDDKVADRLLGGGDGGGAAKERPRLVLALPTGRSGGALLEYPGALTSSAGRKAAVAWVKSYSGSTAEQALADGGEGVRALPAFPEPKRPRKKASAKVQTIGDDDALGKRCYDLAGKTCALVLLGPDGAGGEEAAALASKYRNDAVAVGAVDCAEHPAFAAAFCAAGGEEGGGCALPALVLVKGGKRPRYVRSDVGADVDAMAALVDATLGGGASFTKLAGGLPRL